MKINFITLKEQTRLFLHSCLIIIAVLFTNTGNVASLDPERPAGSVKIGLLIQESKHTSALQGAEMAVRIANKKGGMNGLPFQLVVRSMEGPWGTGSKQAVNLIYEEKVWALFGSHDGRNAHLVEQAATKSTVVFVSAWSADPTLSQAFVPWFFNCVPNDQQQTDALIEEIYNRRKLDGVAVISENDYDSKQALNHFLKKIRQEGKDEPVQLICDNSGRDIDNLYDRITRTGMECLILFCGPANALKLVRLFRQRKVDLPVFGSLHLLNENELTSEELKEFDNGLLIPSGEWSGLKSRTFIHEYKDTYGKHPGVVAAYAFDGMSLLIEAIRNAGVNDREAIQKALEVIRYEGVTGTIRFDDMGNRNGIAVLSQIRNGLPAAVTGK